MSLTKCLMKLGKNVSAEDRAAIQGMATEYRKAGQDHQEAAMTAVRDHMAALDEQHATMKAAGPQPAAKVDKPEAIAQAAIDRAAAEVSTMNPDLMVQMDGMDGPVRVGDLLEAVKKEAADDASVARLVQVAAECALRN